MNVQHIELDQGQRLIAAALARAAAERLAIAVAVTDPAGHLVALARMDGVRYLAVDAARRKAVTAAGLGAATHQLAQWAAKDASFGTAFVGSDTLTLLAGGLPIMAQGTVIGGLGIAGGTSAQDQLVAEAALAAS